MPLGTYQNDEMKQHQVTPDDRECGLSELSCMKNVTVTLENSLAVSCKAKYMLT